MLVNLKSLLAFAKKNKQSTNGLECEVNNMVRRRKSQMIRGLAGKKKGPLNRSKHVGIEIEFDSASSLGDIFADFTDAGLSRHVSLVTDCSVDSWLRDGDDWDDDEGYEVRIIDTQKNIANTLKKVCDVLKKHKAEVSSDCGLHVHIDCRSRDTSLVFKNLLKAQKLLYRLVKEDRLNSSYGCYRDIHTATQDSRHRFGIEVSRINTVEVRMHHGTVDFNEINNWINLLTKIAGKRTKYKRKDYVSPLSLLNAISLEKDKKKGIRSILKSLVDEGRDHGFSTLMCY
ncbi:MAG: hypothetical protein COB41_00100 [Proteobacteria bacterium]|nr:MAG: hypothetical protein COB41_00100 [Pseudomonadota bacterium]